MRVIPAGCIAGVVLAGNIALAVLADAGTGLTWRGYCANCRECRWEIQDFVLRQFAGFRAGPACLLARR